MEDIPPSYETATTRDYWAIVAQYIASSDLCAASLVSKRWHEIFAPYLWGNPASHFGTENDAVYGKHHQLLITVDSGSVLITCQWLSPGSNEP